MVAWCKLKRASPYSPAAWSTLGFPWACSNLHRSISSEGISHSWHPRYPRVSIAIQASLLPSHLWISQRKPQGTIVYYTLCSLTGLALDPWCKPSGFHNCCTYTSCKRHHLDGDKSPFQLRRQLSSFSQRCRSLWLPWRSNPENISY